MPASDAGEFAREARHLADVLRDAAQIALKTFRGEVRHWIKGHNSPVSDADLAVDTFLREKLSRPDIGWLSEESADDLKRLQSERLYIVDPIDGTRAYLAGNEDWSICAALIERGRPVACALYAPVLGDMYVAARGGGATRNDAPIAASKKSTLDGALLIASGGLFKKKIWKEPWPEVETEWVNSVAYRLALVACGRADATISLSNKSEWDLAAAALLVEEAGGIVTDHHGGPHRYNRAIPRFPSLVASGKALHPLLIERTRRIDLDRRTRPTPVREAHAPRKGCPGGAHAVAR